MRFCGRLISFLALVLFLLPVLTAQEEKKDDKKTEVKKDAEKKDPEKKDSEKPEKGTEEKKKEPTDEKFVYGLRLSPVKLLKADGGEYTIEVQVPDAQKIYDMEVWKAGQIQNLARQTNPQQYAQQYAQYQLQLAQKVITSPKAVDIKAGEGMKVRMMYPPLIYDDQGVLKRYTQKQLTALKGTNKGKWPGTYPGEVDMLKPGQIVEVYISKSSMPMPVKASKLKKRADIEAEAAAAATTKMEAMLIVVLQEPLKQ